MEKLLETKGNRDSPGAQNRNWKGIKNPGCPLALFVFLCFLFIWLVSEGWLSLLLLLRGKRSCCVLKCPPILSHKEKMNWNFTLAVKNMSNIPELFPIHWLSICLVPLSKQPVLVL
jgi:hypothetical protein